MPHSVFIDRVQFISQLCNHARRLTLERLNQLEPWISALADEFNEAALQAEADDAKKQADALLADVEKERRQTDRLRLKDDSRDRRRRSRSREHDRCLFDNSMGYASYIHFRNMAKLSGCSREHDRSLSAFSQKLCAMHTCLHTWPD